ncbi:MAG: 2Fe-2S iron-sulfur cluster-binding protein [Byssovorax sp.]
MNASIFDWNQGIPLAAKTSEGILREEAPLPGVRDGGALVHFGRGVRGVKVVDETLRDGLQNASGVNPAVDYKVDLLHAMAKIGVDVVSVGLPAAGKRHADDCHLLCKEILDARLPLVATAAARTVVADVEGIATASQRAGMPIEVYSFIGSSPIRHYAESWDLDFLLGNVRRATETAVKNGLPFCLVTEDTTRAHPDILRALFRTAIDAGAVRLCLCDTTGHVTPYGVEELIAFVRAELAAMGATHVELDWHAHNDRGLSVATALWAASIGVHRIHGTGLGVGERVGNSSLEILIDNLGKLGIRTPVPAEHLVEYCQLAARALHWEIPPDHPIAGERFARERREARPYRRAPGDGDASAPPASIAISGERDRLVPMKMIVGETEVELAVHPRRTLLEALRYDLDLIGTKQGCDKGDCGACTVVLDGKAVLSCLTLALEADGKTVQTVETIGGPHLDPLVDCFDKAGGGQCGFCTPGMLMSATALLDRNPSPSRDEIKLAISGNLCRCTGYGRIVDAVEQAAKIRRGEAPAPGAPDGAGLPVPLTSNERKPRAERSGQ